MRPFILVLVFLCLVSNCAPGFTVTESSGMEQTIDHAGIREEGSLEIYKGEAFMSLDLSEIKKLVLDHKKKKNMSNSLFISGVITFKDKPETADSVWVKADKTLIGKVNSGEYTLPMTEVKVLIQN